MFFVFATQDRTECSTNNKTLKALFFTRQQGEREFTVVRASQIGLKNHSVLDERSTNTEIGYSLCSDYFWCKAHNDMSRVRNLRSKGRENGTITGVCSAVLPRKSGSSVHF